MSSRLWHLGNVVVDLVLDVPALPERGGDVLATRTEHTPGGGFNVMAAAARQGLAVTYAGAHGTGRFGDRARAALHAENIDVLLAPRTEEDTGFVVCLVDADGERTFVTSPGAEATLRSADLAELRPGAGDLVYVTGYSLLHDSNRAALLDLLPRLDPAVTLVTDPGPLVRDIPVGAVESLLARSDWWSCNAREAALLTGLDDPAEAARALNPGWVAARCSSGPGPRGVSCTRADGSSPCPGSSSTPSMSTAPATRTPGCSWPPWLGVSIRWPPLTGPTRAPPWPSPRRDRRRRRTRHGWTCS